LTADTHSERLQRIRLFAPTDAGALCSERGLGTESNRQKLESVAPFGAKLSASEAGLTAMHWGRRGVEEVLGIT